MKGFLNIHEEPADKNPPYWNQSNLYKAVENSHAVILLTAWDEYKTIDWGNIIKCKSPFGF